MIDNILVGSASWTDKTLIACGRFYPPGCNSPEARLRHYATQFPMVEVDSSYYGLPTAHNARLWADRTPAGFVFNIKAFRLFTGHTAQAAVLPRDIRQALGPQAPPVLREADLPAELRDELWRRFLEAIAPLRQAGKLGAVHFQFAPGVHRQRDGLALLARCAERMQGVLCSAEFRHRSWFEGANAQATLDVLGQLGLVHTVVDGPQGFSNCVPCVWAVTNPRLALVRLHGRNAAAWNRQGLAASSSRFDYSYTADELAAMVPEIAHLATLAEAVHVVFNTNYEDQGQAGARLMRALLDRAA